MSSYPRIVDAFEVEDALDTLLGLASLLIDAAHNRDPSQAGVLCAARYLEEVHTRLARAVGLKEVGE